MKFVTLALLSTFTVSDAFYKSHDIVTHDDGSVHMFEKTQHRRLTTNNLKTNSDSTNTKFTVHGSQYVTGKLHVDDVATLGGLELENNDDTFGTNALNALAGNGITVTDDKLTVDTVSMDQKEYRLEKMILVLCNSIGIKYEHLIRAVGAGTFDPYERFGAIEVNDDDLYSTDSTGKLIDVTAVTAALCSTHTDYANACASGYSNKHALARCATDTCAVSDFAVSGLCCIPDAAA